MENLKCPKCGKIITKEDLKHWKCTKCGASFKVDFIPKNQGKCRVCGKQTKDKNKFTDDYDDEVGYYDFCCDECWEGLEKNL